MPWYIYRQSDNKVIGSCKQKPGAEDLATRNEMAHFQEVEIDVLEGFFDGAAVVKAVLIKTLDEAKSDKHAEITTARDAAIGTEIEYGGYAYDADSRSQSNLTATVAACNAGILLPEGFVWRTADNQNVPMDATALAGLAAVMLVQGNAAYQKSWQLKAQLDAAATVAAVEQIVW